MRSRPRFPSPAPECPAEVLHEGHRLSRRRLVGTATSVVLAGCTKAERWAVRPVVAQAGKLELDLADFPPLAAPGGMVAIQPQGTKRPILVMRIENDQVRAFSLRCPHLGCTVRWDNEQQLLVCPCHGSTFSDTGRVLKGPSDRSLEPYQAVLVETQIRISLPEDA